MKRFITALFFLASSISATVNAQAARYWVANPTDHNWSNPANWSATSGGEGGASVPTIFDDVYFDENSTGNCILDENASVNSFQMQPSFAYTFLQNNSNLTVGIGGTQLKGGTFQGGSGIIEFNNLLLSGATMQATSGTMNIKGNFNFTSGNFSDNNGTIEFNDTIPQTLTNATGVFFHNLTINNDSGVSMRGQLSCDGVVILENGILDTHQDTLNLGANGSLVEMPIVASSYVKGYVSVSRNIGSSAGSQSFGGIGITITEPVFLSNPTIVVRQTGTAIMDVGISRYFDVIPAINIGLLATVEFSYFDVELHDLYEPSLSLYKASLPYDSASPGWQEQAASFDQATNTFTQSGVTDFSRWTVGIAGSLPLSVISFSAERAGGNAQLRWLTNAEEVTYFTLSKSADGKNFTELETVSSDATGNLASYTYVDPIQEVSMYYRLIEKDKKGSIRYSKILYLEDGNEFSFNAYTDVSGELVIRLSGQNPEETSTLKIVDLSGRTLYSAVLLAGDSEESIRFSGETAVYMVSINNGNDIARKKIKLN